MRGFASVFVVVAILVALALGAGVFIFGKKPLPPEPADSGLVNFGKNPPPRPMDENGPQNDQTFITFSKDGGTWDSGTLIAKQASVPDLLELSIDLGKFKKGELLVYYVDFSEVIGPGEENISVIVSSDKGRTWSKKTSIKISNKPNKGAAVDPSIIQLSDGRLRIYFFGSDITQGDPALISGDHKVYSAISSDGINFETEDGVRLEEPKLTDPEVIMYKNLWYMYYSTGPDFKLATSEDGLRFNTKTLSGETMGGVPGALEINGGVRVWSCGRGLTQSFAPDGLNFRKEQEDIFNGEIQGVVCDPAVVKLSDGRFAMLYKFKKMNFQKPPQGL